MRATRRNTHRDGRGAAMAPDAPRVDRPLDEERLGWIDAASQAVTEADAERLLASMVDQASPTGDEGPLAQLVAEYLGDAGVAATCQHLADRQANVVGRVPSTGDGSSLLLYGHLDTHLSGDPADDAPAAYGAVARMSRPGAFKVGDELHGLGASNPKGYSAAMVLAAVAIARAGVPLRGDLIVGLAAGGMPTAAPEASRRCNIGLGVGCAFMLQHGLRPDFAIIGKPGHAVAWEEVGLLWCRMRVRGAFGYAGTRHILEYRNPIVGAAWLTTELETWLEQYAREQTSGFVAPQGAVGSITAGWPHKPAFVPAWADLYLDLRVSPRTDPREVRRLLERAIGEIAERRGIEVEVDVLAAIPGSITDPSSWIVQSCVRAFERVEGRPHEPTAMTSGATDAAILRMWGIPTARFGMASRVRSETPTLAMDMDSVHLPSLMRYVRALLHVVVDTCTRTRADIS